jgi:hypothetical protein
MNMGVDSIYIIALHTLAVVDISVSVGNTFLRWLPFHCHTRVHVTANAFVRNSPRLANHLPPRFPFSGLSMLGAPNTVVDIF